MPGFPESLPPLTRRASLAGLLCAGLPLPATAGPDDGTGVTDAEILIGNTVPYSGPASAWGTVGRAMQAVFDQANAEGGIRGRRIRFLSRDDGYNPARTVEQARRLVEDDGVLLLLAPLGTAQNTAIRPYMNRMQVPQLFVNSGASTWSDPRRFPWTMGFTPSYATEGRAFARHIRATRPQARVGVLLQNDDFGRDYLQGVLDGLGEQAATMLVSRQTYEVADATVDSQVLSLQASGADTFINISTPKFAAQAIRRAAESGWKPLQFLVTGATSVGAVMRPAGLDNGQGVISSAYLRDPSDPAQQAGAEFQAYAATLRRFAPALDVADSFNVNGYTVAQAMLAVLRQAGDTLTRRRIMQVAARLDLRLPMLAPGIALRTTPDDFRPVSQLQLTRFSGQRFVPFGPLIDG